MTGTSEVTGRISPQHDHVLLFIVAVLAKIEIEHSDACLARPFSSALQS